MKYKEREKEIMENRPKRDLVDYDAIAKLSRKGNFLPKPLADCRLQICHEVIEMQYQFARGDVEKQYNDFVLLIQNFYGLNREKIIT